MKGKILGFTPSTGAGVITGDDGNRYGFSLAEWRGDKAVTPGLAVDFDVRGSEAVGIYPVAGGAPAMPDLSALAASPAAQRAISLGKTTLAFPLAILVLIACILPVISTASMGGRSLSLFGIDPMVTEIQRMADDTIEMSESRQKSLRQDELRTQAVIDRTGPNTNVGWFGSGPTAAQQLADLQTQEAKADSDVGTAHVNSIAMSAMILRYAAPALALLLLWLVWTGASSVNLVSLATGGASILAFALLYMLKRSAGSGDMNLVSLSIGAWLLLAAGIGLVLAGLGKVRNPLAQA